MNNFAAAWAFVFLCLAIVVGSNYPLVLATVIFAECYFYLLKQARLQVGKQRSVKNQRLNRASSKRAKQAKRGAAGDHLTNETAEQPSQPTETCDGVAQIPNVAKRVANGTNDGYVGEVRTGAGSGGVQIWHQVAGYGVRREPAYGEDYDIRKTQPQGICIKSSYCGGGHDKAVSEIRDELHRKLPNYVGSALHSTNSKSCRSEQFISAMANCGNVKQQVVEQRANEYGNGVFAAHSEADVLRCFSMDDDD